jgi:hypothetical protein
MSNMTCAKCVETSYQDQSWGPLVIMTGFIELNVAGCVALQGDLSCAKALEALDACTGAACDQQCPVMDSQSYMDWQKCVQTATVGGCKMYDNNALSACAADVSTASTTCHNFMDFKSGVFLYVPMFCSSSG